MAHVEVLPRYAYGPLGEHDIRVLVLEPGTFGAPLYGHLVPVRMPDGVRDQDPFSVWPRDYYTGYPIRYGAISYAWGPAEYPYHITLDGSGVLGITLSLYQALQRFRNHHGRINLWADAICINQCDKLEKSSQVRKMGQIYREARVTLIWLGESDGLDWLVFGVFAVIDSGCRLNEGLGLSVEELGSALLDLRQSCVCCPAVRIENASVITQLAAQTIKTFFDRPWFKRLWVVQEYALSKNVILHCGSHTYKAHDAFNGLFHWVDCHQKDSPFCSATLKNVLQGIPGIDLMNSDRLLLDLLRTTAPRKCADARDRVFAIKDLCEAQTWLETAPDYFIEVTALFTRVVFQCFSKFDDHLDNRDHHPAVLMCIAPATKGLQSGLRDLPSWVPDFQHLDHHLSRFTWQRYRSNSSNSPFSTHIAARLGRSPLELRMYGVMCGTVLQTLHGSEVELTGPIGPDDESFGVKMLKVFPETKRLADWLRRGGHFMREHHVVASRPETFSSLSLTNTYVCNFDLEDLSRITSAMELAGSGLLPEDRLEVVEKLFARGLATYIGPTSLFSAIHTDTFPRTGWVPADTQQGDELWFMEGCPWPFVLRRLPGADAYQLVGDACFPHLFEFEVLLDLGHGEQNDVYIR